MGSNHALSNGREPQELTELLNAFQEANQVIISITMASAKHNGKSDMMFQAIAQNNHQNPVVRQRWGSVKCLVWGSDWVRLMGLYSNLLYKLDFLIGEAEQSAIGVKKA